MNEKLNNKLLYAIIITNPPEETLKSQTEEIFADLKIPLYKAMVSSYDYIKGTIKKISQSNRLDKFILLFDEKDYDIYENIIKESIKSISDKINQKTVVWGLWNSADPINTLKMRIQTLFAQITESSLYDRTDAQIELGQKPGLVPRSSVPVPPPSSNQQSFAIQNNVVLNKLDLINTTLTNIANDVKQCNARIVKLEDDKALSQDLRSSINILQKDLIEKEKELEEQKDAHKQFVSLIRDYLDSLWVEFNNPNEAAEKRELAKRHFDMLLRYLESIQFEIIQPKPGETWTFEKDASSIEVIAEDGVTKKDNKQTKYIKEVQGIGYKYNNKIYKKAKVVVEYR